MLYVKRAIHTSPAFNENNKTTLLHVILSEVEVLAKE